MLDSYIELDLFKVLDYCAILFPPYLNPHITVPREKPTMDKNTTSSSNGHNPERVPTCMTAEELASYQAQWEQIDHITTRKLREVKGMLFLLSGFSRMRSNMCRFPEQEKKKSSSG